MRRARRSGSADHASHLEDDVIKDLEEQGIEYEYEPRTFDYNDPIQGGFCGECNSKAIFKRRRYTPDLKIGNSFWVEIKGKFTPSLRRRMESFLKDPRNAGLDLRFLFQRDNWLTGKHKSKYSDWATSQGCKWAVGSKLPETWVEEWRLIQTQPK